MLRKLLLSLGIGVAMAPAVHAAEPPAPYPTKEINFIYNLLFCDDPALFKADKGIAPAPWQSLLLEKPDAKAIRALAENKAEESRVRALAYNWLRKNNHQVPKHQLLGVIVEVPLEKGLDVLAAYADGRVRYLNQSGKLAVFESAPPAVEAKAKELVSVSQPVVERIGPWDKPRLPPPQKGNVRMTFLVSDGLYFGEGPMALMMKDPMAGPIIQKATDLLQLAVAAAVK